MILSKCTAEGNFVPQRRLFCGKCPAKTGNISSQFRPVWPLRWARGPKLPHSPAVTALLRLADFCGVPGRALAKPERCRPGRPVWSLRWARGPGRGFRFPLPRSGLRCPVFASGGTAPSQKADRGPCSASAVSAAGSASTSQPLDSLPSLTTRAAAATASSGRNREPPLAQRSGFCKRPPRREAKIG